jgi:hypothetical protein
MAPFVPSELAQMINLFLGSFRVENTHFGLVQVLVFTQCICD